MWMRISGRQVDNFEMLTSGSITGRGGLCSRQSWNRLWSRLWSLLSVLVGRRCTCSFASPGCLKVFYSAIWARNVSGRVLWTKHSRVSLYRSHHLSMPRNLNTPRLDFSDLGTRFLDQVLHFLYCGARKPSFGHFGHVQGQAHVRLFQQYTTSLPCHCSRHVEYIQEIRCCVKQWDAANTSTIYTSVTSWKVIKVWFVHFRGCLSQNSSGKIQELTTSWCSIWRTVRTYALVDHGGFLLRAAMNWSRSFWRTPATWCTVNWLLLTTVWIYSQPTACCFWFVLLPVLRTIFECASWVIFLVAPFAASWWTNWCLHSCCVPISDVFIKAPANRLDSDLLGPSCGGCVSIICRCGIAAEDDNEKKWEVLRII